jgi:8-oxo-dGTP pyrophosphatase MutT (NUDIX family)/uncharacterized cupin superfamily protein
MPITPLHAFDIEASLLNQTRQYLVGNLANPQTLAHIPDTDIEVGISDYRNATFESAHKHARAKEYQYVLKGMTEYLDLDGDTAHRFVAGDFFVIYPGTSYLQRIKRDTRILFFKYPAGNDKEAVSVTADQTAWAREPLRVQRLDLTAGKGVPAPNALKPGVAVAIFDADNRLLVVKRRDSGFWAMPGGVMELSESLETCAHREIREETGIEITITGLIGAYTDPATIIAYSDGEVRREFSVLLAASPLTRDLSHDDESTALAWVGEQEMSAYPVVASQQRRIVDAWQWRKNGGFALR